MRGNPSDQLIFDADPSLENTVFDLSITGSEIIVIFQFGQILFLGSALLAQTNPQVAFILQQDTKGRRKILARQNINMKEYASIVPSQHEIKISLKPVSKKVIGGSLQFTLSCVFLREGKAT